MRKKVIVCFACILLLICLVFFVLHALNTSSGNEYFIFNTLTECENLIPTDETDVTVVRYTIPSCDKDIEGLSYRSFFGMKLQSDALKYEIFAYEFDDAESALAYGIRASGRYDYKVPEDQESKFWSLSRGTTSVHIVVAFRNKAYQLNAPSEYTDEIKKLLAEVFSQKLP